VTATGILSKLPWTERLNVVTDVFPGPPVYYRISAGVP
jgi:hypothetical protein